MPHTANQGNIIADVKQHIFVNINLLALEFYM
jgi:hypothetical protein